MALVLQLQGSVMVEMGNLRRSEAQVRWCLADHSDIDPTVGGQIQLDPPPPFRFSWSLHRTKRLRIGKG